MIDIHAHILPGVDDGSKNPSETEKLLKLSWKQGVTEIIATPHFSHHTDFAGLRERYEQTKKAAQRIDPRFKIYLGQEILYFEGMTDWLGSGQSPDIGGQPVCSRRISSRRQLHQAFSGSPRACLSGIPPDRCSCRAV